MIPVGTRVRILDVPEADRAAVGKTGTVSLVVPESEGFPYDVHLDDESNPYKDICCSTDELEVVA